MAGEKLSISYDDVNSDKVDQRLRSQEDAERNFQPAAPPPPAKRGKSHGFLYNTAVYTALFGLIGGALGWACGEIPRKLLPNHKAEYEELLQSEQRIEKAVAEEKLLPVQARSALKRLAKSGENNPYYRVRSSDQSADEKAGAMAKLETSNHRAELVADIFFLAVAGMVVATMLAIADALVERNTRAMLINGSVGAALGLVGGVAAAVTRQPLFEIVEASLGGTGLAAYKAMTAQAVTWGVLGIFLAIAPGVVMRNPRKLMIGLLGGMIGGIIGGLLWEVVSHGIDYNQRYLGRLIAIASIGTLAGLAVGLIENVAKRGWLKITAGVIAGKQFVLYRNPTFIGSSLSCSIYLFRDPSVGPRHAAIHIAPSGFEIENLPLGTATMVNGKPIHRHRLRDNDEIQIGQTTMVFHGKKDK